MLLTSLVNVASASPTTSHNYWWYIGLGIGFAIVTVVVVVAASILALAGRIGNQAREGIELMDEARVMTLPVWEVQKTNVALTGIWRAAEAARESLQGVTRTGGTT